VGTAANDAIDGGAGDDTICALAGGDKLDGGAGNDTMFGGPGADKFDGGTGTDSAPDFSAAERDTKKNVP
jgi:Ca2+-binding RTX toxin-like protein